MTAGYPGPSKRRVEIAKAGSRRVASQWSCGRSDACLRRKDLSKETPQTLAEVHEKVPAAAQGSKGGCRQAIKGNYMKLLGTLW